MPGRPVPLAILTALVLIGCSAPTVTISARGSLGASAGDKRYRPRSEALGEMLAHPPPVALGLPRPAPGRPDPYVQLLAFLRRGPGGSAVERRHLVAVAPSLLALGALAAAAPGWSVSQLVRTPQGQAAYLAVLGVFRPLGLTTAAVGSWLRARAGTLRPILTTLYAGLTATPSPQTVGVDRVLFDPSASTAALISLWRARDWLTLAELGPGLIHSLTRHLGHGEPRIVLYADRDGYAPAVHVPGLGNVSEHGYVPGAGLQQGPEDVTLSYYLVSVRRGNVTTDAVEASALFLWAREASGGDPSPLDSARQNPNTLASLDLDWSGSHLRIAAGATPHRRTGGLFLEQRLDTELLSARASAGVLMLEDDATGYADIEVRLDTPRLSVAGDGGTASAWLRVAASAAALVGRAAQGDARLVPELLSEIKAGRVTATLSAGLTWAVVPHGRVDLEHPPLALRHVLTHAQGLLTVEAGPVLLEWGAVAERSGLRTRARLWTGLTVGGASARAVVELELSGGAPAAYYGGSLAFEGAAVSVLTSGHDTRAQAGFEVSW